MTRGTVKEDGVIYEGDWVNDNMEGKGIKMSPTGEIYERDFVNNKFEGNGKIIFRWSSLWSGWINGKKEAKGKMISPREEIYERDWVNDPKKKTKVLLNREICKRLFQ